MGRPTPARYLALRPTPATPPRDKSHTRSLPRVHTTSALTPCNSHHLRPRPSQGQVHTSILRCNPRRGSNPDTALHHDSRRDTDFHVPHHVHPPSLSQTSHPFWFLFLKGCLGAIPQGGSSVKSCFLFYFEVSLSALPLIVLSYVPLAMYQFRVIMLIILLT